MATKVVIVPEGIQLSEEDKEKIRAELGGDTVETLSGTRAQIAFSVNKYKAKEKEEVAVAKDLPIEKIKEAL